MLQGSTVSPKNEDITRKKYSKRAWNLSCDMDLWVYMN